MRRSPSFSRALLLWLALSAIVYRGLIPAGFMPVFAGDGAGVGLALCSGGALVRSDRGKDGGKTAVMEQCAYAAASVPVVPAAAPAQVPAQAVALPVQIANAATPRLAPTYSLPPARGPPATL
jgi:hypothetical protein